MIVYRAVGGRDWDVLRDNLVLEHGAIFVCESEIQALGWALMLGKHDYISLNVKCIRDKKTLNEIQDFQDTIDHITLSGVKEKYKEMRLREAVVLSSDII